ncbi:hypothetical protein IEQ34_002388 [Dendrobium chrysotoxum]|uniref:Uncharacterized protein n=1 Tax=Dendrobium chrysotoxum TaxID=161865 RepID=A0AAV7HJA7_DENCH|nr:hypothetical protein IEQ34_002388 [Dendrobium chrysotoxum]
MVCNPRLLVDDGGRSTPLWKTTEAALSAITIAISVRPGAREISAFVLLIWLNATENPCKKQKLVFPIAVSLSR